MRRFAHAAVRASVFVIATGLLTGCSKGDEKAVPKLPERVCWGAFAGSDVASILPPGDKAEFDVDGASFFLTGDHDSASCNLYIDGNTGFLATADLQEFEESIDWTTWYKAKPKPLDAGDRAIVWHNGAAAYFTCEPAKNPNSPGKYVELSLSVHFAADESKVPGVLSPLMKQFVAFAQRELKCGADATN
ncbi:hypothetical protein [Streptomyces sp. NPDC051909]|uniref:hypothetical protein n=1 Tax=Streptomyces sp. NPDC051909 TaxID=3154944 RepID=UPI003413AB2F